MYQNVNARAERLFLLIKHIVLWRSQPLPLPSSLLKLPIDSARYSVLDGHQGAQNTLNIGSCCRFKNLVAK